MDSGELKNSLTNHSIIIRGESVSRPLSVAQAADGRDAFVKVKELITSPSVHCIYAFQRLGVLSELCLLTVSGPGSANIYHWALHLATLRVHIDITQHSKH